MGGKTSTSSQQVTIPPEVMARYNAVNARAETAADTPFKQYSTDPSAFVAQLTGPQQAGIQGTMNAAGQAQPYFEAATNQLMGAQGSAQPLMSQAQSLARGSARDVNPGELQTQQYMSPYIGNVVEAQRGLMQRQQEAQMSGAMGQAIRSGAYGGDRAGIAAANLGKEQQLAQAGVLSPLLQQGYTQALQTAQQQQGLGLSAEQANRATQAQAAQLLGGLGAQQYGMGAQTSQALAGLGTGAQGAALQGAQAQMGAGQMAQQTEQAGLQALYNQFLQQQSYPFQVAQFLGNIAMGTGALSGSTTTGRQPGGFFSDERLKEGIEEVGTLHDGQPIFKFKYKGEPDSSKRIGLMADEVEKTKPDAVGLAGGFRTVNYDEATKDAASMGGGVKPHHAGEPFAAGGYAAGGYADGGSPLPPGLGGADMSALLQAQAQMYSPYMSQGPYMGASSPAYGGGAYVPQGTLPVTSLVTPDGSLPEQPSVTEHMRSIAELGEMAGKGYAAAKKRGLIGGEGPTTTTVTPGGLSPQAQAEQDLADRTAAAETAREMQQQSAGMNPRARGGVAQGNLFDERIGAMDGGAMPYSGGSNQGLSIPQQAGDQSLSLQAPAPLPQVQSGLSQLSDLAGSAGSFMSGINSFKPKPAEKAAGGPSGLYAGSGPGLNIPQDQDKPPEMLKGTELNKGRSPMDDVKDVAQIVGMFMAHGGVAGGRHGYQTDGRVEPGVMDKVSELNFGPSAKTVFEAVRSRLPESYASAVQSAGEKLERAREAGDPIAAGFTGLAGATADFYKNKLKVGNSPLFFDYKPGMFASPAAPPRAGASGSWGDTPPKPAGGPRPPARPAGAPMAPTQTSSSLIEAGRPSAAQLAASVPAGLAGGAVGMSPAEQQAGLAARERPAGMSSTGQTADELAAYRGPGQKPGQLRGQPGRVETMYQQAIDKAKGMGLNKAENLIPLLTGIAAMGTAPTRSLGVALASGVGAGAQSYLPTRQAMEDIKQTQTTTGRIGAETAGTQAQTLAQYKDIYAQRGYTLVEDPNGKIAIDGKKYAAVPQASLQSGQKPIGDIQLGLISPDVAKGINNDSLTYIKNSPELRRDVFASQGEIFNAGTKAQQDIQTLAKFGTMAGSLVGGSIEPGVFAGAKQAVAKYAIDLVRTIGGEDALRSLNLDDLQKGLINTEVLDKLQQMAARQASETSGGDTFKNLEFALEMMAGKQLQPEASAKLIASVMSQAMQNVDLAQYANDVSRVVGETSGDRTLGRFVDGSEIRKMYAREAIFSPAQRQKDEGVLADFFAKGMYPLVQAGLMSQNPEVRAKTQEGITAKFGSPLAYRYFLGRY